MESAATNLQEKVITDTEVSLTAGRDVIIDAPTGSGKSRIFSRIAEKGAQKNQRTIIISGRRNLAKQALRNIEKWSGNTISTSIGMEGKFDQSGQVVSTTVQTANMYLDSIEKYDRLVVDEAHHAKIGNTDYTNLITALERANPNIQIIGASATFPDGMEDMHPRLKSADRHVITFEEAIKAKLIDLPLTLTPNTPLKQGKTIADIVQGSGLPKNDAELNGIGSRIRNALPEDWNESIAWQYSKHFSETKTISFFDSIKEAEAFAKELKEYGINVQTVHSKRSDKENQSAFERFEKGNLMGIVSIDMVSEGYDVDARGLFLAKLTTSAKEYRQIVGRGARSFGTFKGNKTKMIDVGASTFLHGEISAQANINNIAKNIESTSRATMNLEPESDEARLIWRPLEGVRGFAAPIQDGIIYAVPNSNGYFAMRSIKDRKGTRIHLLDIDGQKKGRPSKEAFMGWAENAIRTSEKFIARAMSQAGGIDAIIEADWKAHSKSVLQNIALMAQPMPIQMAGVSR